MLLLLLFSVVAFVGANQTAVVDTNKLYELGLTGLLQRWQQMLRSGATDLFAAVSQDVKAEFWKIFPTLVAKATEIIHDLNQEDEVAQIFQAVQSIPEVAVECLLTWTTENFKDIGSNFDLLLTTWHENNILNVQQVTTSLNVTGVLTLLMKNNFLRKELLGRFLTGHGLMTLFFQTLLPLVIETYIIMFANAGIYQAVENILTWLGAAFQNVPQCESAFISRDLMPHIQYMTTE